MPSPAITLLDTLNTMIDQYSNTDTAWVTFVTDHLAFIGQNCSILVMTDSDRDKYQNMFVRYMRDNGCPNDIIWIAKLVNGLDDYSDFTKLSAVLVPSPPDIADRYRVYRTANNLI